MKVERALDFLRIFGTPKELLTSRPDPRVSTGDAIPNAHIHLPPNFSAFESISQAVSLASAQGVKVLGASNYYHFEIYNRFSAEARRLGVFPLFGIEVIALLTDLQAAGVLVNDPGNPGRMYLCGKGIARFSPMNPAATALMEIIRGNDGERMRRMLELLNGVSLDRGAGIVLDEERIVSRIVERRGADRHTVFLQERHLAQAFQEELFARFEPGQRPAILGQLFETPSKAQPSDHVRIQHEIRSHLMKVGKPAFVPERFLDFGQSVRLILELGGIPCYPTLADGAAPICSYEDRPEKLAESVRTRGIHCAEFIPIRNRPEVLERYVRCMREAGFVVTAGTEHNTLDLLPIEPRCVGGAPIPAGLHATFREGACVVAAHQFMVSRGGIGYVDNAGRLNPAFSSAEERIGYFRDLGSSLIARYHQRIQAEGEAT